MARYSQNFYLLFIGFALCAFSSAYSADFLLGIGTHYGQNSPSSAAAAVKNIRDTGASSFRDEIYWTNVEKRSGVYQVPAYMQRIVIDSNKSGIKPLIVLGYGNRSLGIGMPSSEADQEAYAKYAEQIAYALKGSVGFYEIWNEWNLGTGSGIKSPGSATDYVRLIRKVYPRIKRIDPAAQVLVGGVGSFRSSWSWTSMFIALRGLDYSDGFSFHTYNFLDSGNRDPENLFNDVQQYVAKLNAAAKANVPVYITEAGWPGGLGRSSSSDDVIESNLIKYVFLVQSIPSVRGLWWYSLADDGVDKTKYEQNFGLVKANLDKKTAYFAFQKAAGLLKGATFVEQLNPAGRIVLFKYRNQGGSEFLISWLKPGKAASLLNAGKTTITWKPLLGEDSLPKDIAPGESLTITASPYLLEGAITSLVVTNN